MNYISMDFLAKYSFSLDNELSILQGVATFTFKRLRLHVYNTAVTMVAWHWLI